ncbi:hypothetical protein VUR80DRAFT_4051 [Thermomyces stellatus]
MTIAHTGIIVPNAIVAEQIVDHYGMAVGIGNKKHDADFWIIGGDIPEAVTPHHTFASSGKSSPAVGSRPSI